MTAQAGRWIARGTAALLFALPLAAALPLALHEAASADAWRALWQDPQTLPALGASVFTAVSSTVLALLATLFIVTQLHGSRAWARVASALPALLALPHAAFAIGLAWLLAPAGWLARVLAPLLGWSTPPPWETVNDPRGLALVGVLVLKELPFLLWSVAALLARPEVAATLQREQALARTLGYPARSLWWRVGWLQWLPRLAWPLLAVLAYSLTVVDLAVLVGPGSPPTLAVLAWQRLSDASPARNAEGAAAALLLTAVLALLVALGAAAFAVLQRAGRRLATQGRRPRRWATAAGAPAKTLAAAVALAYTGALLSLAMLSAAGAWPFPALWPALWSLQPWQQVAEGVATVSFTAALAAAAAVLALGLTVAWLEASPPRWDRRLMPLVLAPLVLPQLLLMAGLYRGALALQLDGTVGGLVWVHVLMVLPYVFTALAPAWRSFDPRYGQTALALGRSRLAFWWRVKWPLLAAPLAAALAVGFAVSVAQYLSTQFIGAGRHATLTTEAVTLAAGGQRNTAAAFALLQALLPVAGFALAWGVGRRAAAAGTR